MKIEHKDAALWSDIYLGLSCENVQCGGGGGGGDGALIQPIRHMMSKQRHINVFATS